jgi:hypothetical protein
MMNHLIESLYNKFIEKYGMLNDSVVNHDIERNYELLHNHIYNLKDEDIILLLCKLIANTSEIENLLVNNPNYFYEGIENKFITNKDEFYDPLYINIPKQSLKNLEQQIEKYCKVNNDMLDDFYKITVKIKEILSFINENHIYYNELYINIDFIGDRLLVDSDDNILHLLIYNKKNWNIAIFINEILQVKSTFFEDCNELFIHTFTTIIRYLPLSEMEYFHKKMETFININMEEIIKEFDEPNNCSIYNNKFLIFFTYLNRLRYFSYKLDYVEEFDEMLIKYAQNAMSSYLYGDDINYTDDKITFESFEIFINGIISDSHYNGNYNDEREYYICYYAFDDHERVHKLMLKFMNYCINILSVYEYRYDNEQDTKYVDFLFKLIFGYFHNLEYNNIELVSLEINKPIFEQYLRNRFTVSNRMYEIEQSDSHFNIINL